MACEKFAGSPADNLAMVVSRRPEVLKKRADFVRVQRTGKRYRGRLMVVLAAPSRDSAAPGCVGFTVSRKVGNAVVRNKVRRRLKEIVRHNVATVAAAHEYVVIAFANAAVASFTALQREALCLLAKASGRP